jgi:hypothetical protein
VTNSADAFVDKIDWNAKTSFFNKPPLNRVEQFGMLFVINVLKLVTDSIAMFVDIADAILPNSLLPFLRWSRVFENSLITIDRSHLTRLFVHGHLADQICNTILDRGLGIFIKIPFAVLIPVDPTLGVAGIFLCKQKLATDQNEHGRKSN